MRLGDAPGGLSNQSARAEVRSRAYGVHTGGAPGLAVPTEGVRGLRPTPASVRRGESLSEGGDSDASSRWERWCHMGERARPPRDLGPRGRRRDPPVRPRGRSAARAASTNLAAAADTYDRSDRPNSNYGGSNRIIASAGSMTGHGFLRFDAQIPSQNRHQQGNAAAPRAVPGRQRRGEPARGLERDMG